MKTVLGLRIDTAPTCLSVWPHLGKGQLSFRYKQPVKATSFELQLITALYCYNLSKFSFFKLLCRPAINQRYLNIKIPKCIFGHNTRTGAVKNVCISIINHSLLP